MSVCRSPGWDDPSFFSDARTRAYVSVVDSVTLQDVEVGQVLRQPPLSYCRGAGT